MELKKVLYVGISLTFSVSLTILVTKNTSKSNPNKLNSFDLANDKETEKRAIRNAYHDSKRETASEFYFYVMGDIPYSENEQRKLKDHLKDLSSSGKFVVHVGDMQKTSSTHCEYNAYNTVRDIIYYNSRLPVFMLPGDNDYLDCDRPNHARAVWLKHFSNFEENWNLPFRVERQGEKYDYWDDDADDDCFGCDESDFDDTDFADDDYGVQFWNNARSWQVSSDSIQFTFVYRGVIFIGLNLLPGSGQSSIFSEMIDWTEQSLLRYEGDYDAIVIFGHAGPSHIGGGYFDKLKRIHDDSWLRDIPLLYLHGNGHVYNLYKPFSRDNMVALQVDQGMNAPPLKVTVDFDKDFPFSFDRRK